MHPQISEKYSSQYSVTSLMYSNVASLVAKYDDFCAHVSAYKPSIILLSETWLTSRVPDSMVSAAGYTIFRSDRIDKKGGGVCMYI